MRAGRRSSRSRRRRARAGELPLPRRGDPAGLVAPEQLACPSESRDLFASTALKMSSGDRDAQEDELLALASIYDEDEFKRAPSGQGGEIRVLVDLPEDFTLLWSGKQAENLQNNRFECTVSFLPPIVLNFEFPADYPSASPPAFTLSSKWLHQEQLTALCKHLDTLWEEKKGSVVLFAWIQFLKEETLTYLNITSAFEPIISGEEHEEVCYGAAGGAMEQAETFNRRARLIREILDFDLAQQEKRFNSKMHTCNICFSDKLGSECMLFLDCRHVYCKACVKDYFEIQIKDGQVHCLNCPEPKCPSVATPGQVKGLVEEQLFARYDRLLLQSTLDLMPDVVYCPRLGCQTPVMQEPSCNVGICCNCGYAFCTVCKKTYHGVQSCKIAAGKFAAFLKEYLAADETTKRFLEKHYGKRLLRSAVEEIESKEWLKNYSKLCPSCGAPIEKIDGCNRMTCISCNKNFCWRCMNQLSQEDPYQHFNDPNSPCFNKLR
ncbi:E3 ubiquitin-protein ligase RNF14 [Anolis carolinensis]|uniref:E3 ubiquitin-protein ligase RNF14 n=1 Tax=Anolis carolinensis TaxID=28377 RepID=UPI002F2B6E9D